MKNFDFVKIFKKLHDPHRRPRAAAENCGFGVDFGFGRDGGTGSGGAVARYSGKPGSGQNAANFQGSVATGEVSAQPIGLSLDEAIQRGLKNNLGMILSGTQTASARGQRLSQLQSLLPEVDASGKETVSQVDLPAEGLRIKGFPTILGPFGYTDVRASLSWSLVNLNSLHNYLAARHNFAAAELSAQDARELVVLTVGNAYLLVLADETQVASVEAQVATAKVSLDQAIANHQAGTAPMLDELRARVDYQTLEQQLIVAQNSLEKDKLALARTIGLPLAQSFTLTDKAPYAAFDEIDVDAAIHQAHLNRKDLASLVEQTKAAEEQRKAATADRLPTITLNGDYGDIGTTLAHSHGTGDATGAAERSALQGVWIARRGGDCAGATGYDAGPVERQKRAGGRRYSRCAS